jgi:hypothetical protein
VIREMLIAALYVLGAGMIVLVAVLVTSVARVGPEFPPLPPGPGPAALSRDEEN